jgi:MFS family permease
VVDRRGFRNLWLATSVSQLGTQVSELAIPFIAITSLRATPFQVGVLNAVQFLPILLLSLVVGVWVDRLRRRPVLIASDLARALILFSIPVAGFLHLLSMAQVYLVAFLVGSLTVLFDVAYQSYLPALVADDRLITANSRLQVSEQGASVIGPALAGSLISLITAPIAVAVDAASYLASAGFLLGIRRPELEPSPPEPGTGVIREIAAGLAFVLRQPILRAIAITAGLIQLFGRMVFAILLLYLVRQVGLTAAAVGAVFSIGSAGFVVGALIAGRVGTTFGVGRTIVGAAVLASASPLLYAVGPRGLTGAFVAAGFFLYGVAAVVWTVNNLSLRQAITPRALLGRTNASMRLLGWGAIPVGSVLGGFLGGALGLRETIVLGAAGSLLASLPVLLSPLPRLRRLPQPAPAA